MKGTWRRLVAMLLCLSLSLTMLPAQAAASPSDEPDGGYETLEPDDGGMPEEMDAPEAGETGGEEDITLQAEGDTTYPITGNCGASGSEASVIWSLDANGILTISGKGAMGDYKATGSGATYSPWNNYRGNIKKVVVNEGVTHIGAFACVGNFPNQYSQLTEVTLPESVTSIGRAAFNGCDKLSGITLPGKLEAIGDSAFGGCAALSGVSIPDSVTTIGQYAFANCTGLTSVKLSTGTVTIGRSAFAGCIGLTEVEIPETISTMGQSAFGDCTGLTSVIIRCKAPDVNWGDSGESTLRQYVFNGCTGLKTAGPIGGNYNIQFAWDTTIPLYAFQSSALTSIEIPGTVTTIGDYAFSNCSDLTSVIIPDSVTSIGSSVFYNCKSLTSVVIPDSVTSIGNSAFSLTHTDLVLYCYPDSYAETYAKNNNIKYENIVADTRTLTISVSAPDGTAIGDGFTVIWYSDTGTEAGRGPALSGADPEKPYSFEIQLSTDLAQFYEQPERQTIAPGDEAAREVRLVSKEPVPALVLTGRVLDEEGRPISGAEVSIEAGNGSPATTASGADGGFRVEVPRAVLEATIRKAGYYSEQRTLDLSGEAGGTYAMDDCVLTEVVTVSDRLALGILQRTAVGPEEQAQELPVTLAKSLRFTLTGNGGRRITGFEVQGTTLLFRSGAVTANERITVAAEDLTGKYAGASSEVVLDENRTGSVELTLTEKGGFRLGTLSGPAANWLAFDSSGNCVRTGAAQSGTSSRTMDAGSYSVVLLQKSDLLRSVPSLRYLTTLGLRAGQDYLLREITISNGEITDLGSCAVPVLDESAISYTLAESTSVTTSKPGGAAEGELVLLRASYGLDPSKGVSSDSLNIVLPDGLELVDGSVRLNNAFTTYNWDGSRREVRIAVTGQEAAAACLYVRAMSAGSKSISAHLTLDNGAVQPIGTAAIQVERAKLKVPTSVGVKEGLTASGKTLPNSTVILYDNDREMARTTSNAAGSWSTMFSLAEPVYSCSYHFVHAETENEGLAEALSTEKTMITYNARGAGQLTRITMYNTGDHGAQATVFDFMDSGSTTVPYYRIWPSHYPSFTFKVEFAGEPSKLSEVYVVTANSAGDKTYVKTAYDPGSGAWVGTHNYNRFADAPAQVGAAYALAPGGEEILPLDAEAYVDLLLAASDWELSPDVETQIERTYHVVEDSIANNVDETSGTGTFTAPLVYTDESGQDIDFGSYSITIDELSQAECTPEALEAAGYYPVLDGETAADSDIWLMEAQTGSSFTSSTISISTRTRYMEVMEIDGQPATRSWDDAADIIGALPGVGTPADITKHVVEYIGDLRVLYINLDGSVESLKIRSDTLEKLLLACPSARQFVLEWSGLLHDVDAYYSEGLRLIRLSMASNFMGRAGQIALDSVGGKLFKAVKGKLPPSVTNKLDDFFEKIQKKVSDAAEKIKVPEKLDRLKEKLVEVINEEIAGFPEDTADDIFGGIAEELGSKALELAHFLAISARAREHINSGYEDLNRRYDELQKKILDASDDCEPDDDPPGVIETPRKPATYIADPSGYVYEAVPSNRLEGVKAEIFYQDGSGEVRWNAADYDQVSPQITGADGSYYWDVPQGSWKVKFTKAGYQNADTSKVPAAVQGWLPVPPPQLEINVAMVSTAAPTVSSAVAYEEQAEVVFSQYMDIGSVKSALTLADFDAADITVEPLDAEYDLEGTVQYATRFAVKPADGSRLTAPVTVIVGAGAKNYNQTAMETAYASEEMAPIRKPAGITAPGSVQAALGEPAAVSVTLAPGLAGRTLKIENLTPALLAASPLEVTTGADGTASFTVTGQLPGAGKIRVTDPASGLSAVIAVNVAMPARSDGTVQPVTARLADGTAVTSGMTLPYGTRIYLSTSTPGAAIRYTLNDTCPCTEDALTYSGPITVTRDLVLRAAAEKDGQYSASPNLRLELRVSSSGGSDAGHPGGIDFGFPGGSGSGAQPGKRPGGSEDTQPDEPAEKPAALPFTDIPSGAWYRDAVEYVYRKGMMAGDGSLDRFNPEGVMTRAMVVTILHRMEGEPKIQAAAFTDVAAGQWYTEAIAWASAGGIVSGYGSGAFGPNDPITREQLTAILYRYAAGKGYDITARADLSGYSDAGQISAYAAEPMSWANALGLITGMDDGTLAPRAGATRAQTAAILMRFCQSVAGQSVE